MNALPNDLIRRTSELSEAVTQPIPGSRKVHVEGPAGMRVPMREIALSDTPKVFGAEKNPPFAVYDTSGPYTDDTVKIDLTAGLAELRAGWIDARGDGAVAWISRDDCARVAAAMLLEAARGRRQQAATVGPRSSRCWALLIEGPRKSWRRADSTGGRRTRHCSLFRSLSPHKRWNPSWR